MSKTQDVFGAAPKSVLNKPFLHLQERQPAGSTSDPTLSNAETQRKINTVVTDEIGTSLLNNTFTLPAGTYYCKVKAGVGSGVRYNRVSLKDSADNVILLGMTAGVNAGANDQTDARCEGQFVLTQSTTLKLMHFTNNATGVFGITMTNDPNEEIWLDVQVWKLDSNVETPVISDPTMTLARPLMQVQNIQPSGVGRGNTANGDNFSLFNTTLHAEIAGASLVGTDVELPAGTYQIQGLWAARSGNSDKGVLRLEDSVGTILAKGQGTINDGVVLASECVLNAKITLASTTLIRLNFWSVDTATNGLGVFVPDGEPESYEQLNIWQLDAVNKQPVLVNDKLYPLPGNVIVTGNMHGLKYEYTAPNQITVQAGICMDSVNETVLQLTNPQLVTIPSGVNTVYNLFLTDDGQLVKTDTDVDGTNLPAQDKRRWIGFVTTDGSGNILQFHMNGNTFTAVPSDADSAIWRAATGSNQTWTQFAMSSFVPTSRVESAKVIIKTSVQSSVRFGGGVTDNQRAYLYAHAVGYRVIGPVFTDMDNIWGYVGGGTLNGYIDSLVLKR